MGWKSKVLLPYGWYLQRQIERDKLNALSDQNKILKYILVNGTKTKFGRDFNFASIKCYDDYRKIVTAATYQDRINYINSVLEGETDILWPGKPKYIIGTSGTTGGKKFVPLSYESVPTHFHAAKNAAFNYCYKYGLMSMYDGLLLFLSGSPKLDYINEIPTGRLSGIINHEIPNYLQSNKIPSYDINIIENWTNKMDTLIHEYVNADVRLISGITPWINLLFDKILHYTGKSKIVDVFPNLKLVIHGGVRISPYLSKFKDLVGDSIPLLETYPSTEGFIAFQDEREKNDLLLVTNNWVFYEFVDVKEARQGYFTNRKALWEVEEGKVYALLISNTAGLYASIIGDLVKITSKDPYRIVFAGRIKDYLSPFGEHVIGVEVETALEQTCKELGVVVNEFTVAPAFKTENGFTGHQWFIEFSGERIDIQSFARVLDSKMCALNFHYKELVEGQVIDHLMISPIKSGGFHQHLSAIGKLGGQNKVIHLRDDRAFVNGLEKYILS